MPDTRARLKAMLFDYETTNKTDFNGGKIKDLVFTKYKPKKPRVRPEAKLTKDIHTLTDWKGCGVPFSLLHRHDEITRGNPRTVQQPREAPIDAGLSEAIRTRPRLVMTPAVSMDDVEPGARKLLLDNMYTSDTLKAQRDAVSPYFSVKAPLPVLPAPANPVRLPQLQPPLVPREWRMDSVRWDSRQLRAHCDPTKEFWLRRHPPQCIKCDETTRVLAHRDMQQMAVKKH